MEHFADQDIVVPSRDYVHPGAFEGCQHVRQQGHAGVSGIPTDPLEAVVTAARELIG
jgi:hypothetical protein